jgi:hypothetical protein
MVAVFTSPRGWLLFRAWYVPAVATPGAFRLWTTHDDGGNVVADARPPIVRAGILLHGRTLEWVPFWVV